MTRLILFSVTRRENRGSVPRDRKLTQHPFYTCGAAKTFSLNEAIAAESQTQPGQNTVSAKLEDTPTEPSSLKKPIKPLSVLQKRKKVKESEFLTSLTKGITPLKYRKTYQIKSPLKPKKLKYLIGAKKKRTNQAIKRETNGNDKLQQKHIPLLKSLSMLLDNILGPDSGESFEAKPRRRPRYYFEGSEETCKCATRGKDSGSSPLSEDQTNSVPEPISSEISTATEASAETPHLTSPRHILNIRQNKNLPLLFPRNPLSSRRNDNGLRQGNRTTNNRSYKRYITRFDGDSEHNTGSRQEQSRAESNEENTVSTPRDRASGFRSRNRLRDRNNTRESEKVYPREEDDSESKLENTMDGVGRNLDEFERENKLKIGKNDTESTELIPEPSRRLRGLISEAKVGAITDFIHSEEGNEKGDVDRAGNQRVLDRNGPFTEENKESNEGYETVKSIPEFSAKSSKKQGPVVVIIDGYSVTRHKNGENKLSEMSVHITHNKDLR